MVMKGLEVIKILYLKFTNKETKLLVLQQKKHILAYLKFMILKQWHKLNVKSLKNF